MLIKQIPDLYDGAFWYSVKIIDLQTLIDRKVKINFPQNTTYWWEGDTIIIRSIKLIELDIDGSTITSKPYCRVLEAHDNMFIER